MTLQVPAVGKPRALKAPRIAEAKLRNGLRVLVVRKPTVPRVELRVMSPLGDVRNLAVERVLAKTLMSGTSKRNSVQIAQELQRLGAGFGAGVGRDHFQAMGSVLAPNLGAFLGLVSEILTDATFPSDEVALERGRVVQEIEMSRSQPQVLAAETLRKRLFGRHRYGLVLPEPSAVARVSRTSLQRVFTQSVGPRGGVVVLVGDVQPQAAIELLESTLGRWRAKVAADKTRPPPEPKRGPALFVDRPGSVQTSIKIAGSVPAIGSDDAYAMDIANTIFGGYFVSRWVDNLRERHGYTYSPHSSLVYSKLANHIEISADVGADVTAASLVETSYELGRMCALDVESSELDSAKHYRTGIQALRIQSQAGLASTLASLVTFGLGVEYLKTYPQRINALTTADIRAASESYLAPSRLVTVLVGDASRVLRDVEALGEVQLQAESP
jgi:predicted Zn-dependent peptidase